MNDDPGVYAGGVARGIARLAFDAVDQVTRIVEGMHANVAAAPPPFGAAALERARGISGFVYGSIRFVNSATAAVLDRPLGLVTGPALPQPRWDPLLSAINGVIGDHLCASENPLALPMRFRVGGRTLPLGRDGLAAALPGARGKLVLLAHGLCMSNRQWVRNGHDHGAALAEEIGVTPVYLQYNSGRHVSENGRELAGLLERLVECWPTPVEEITILGHSMGGLVARSACHYAAAAGYTWPRRLARIVFLGTPHHGAPLERAGNKLQRATQLSPYLASLARLGMLRSAGITDLRHGNLLDEDWHGADRFETGLDRRRPLALPPGVDCYAVAATISQRIESLGDGLVPVASALGQHRDPARALAFPESQRWIGAGMNHLDLLDHPEVYAVVRRWLVR